MQDFPEKGFQQIGILVRIAVFPLNLTFNKPQ